MAVIVVMPIEVESVLKDRGYFISDGQHAPAHETPWIHTPPVPVVPDVVRDVPPVPVVPDVVHDVPPVPVVPDVVHDVPPIDIIHDGVHDLPIIHIPMDQVVESRYAKYMRFLPLILLFIPESEILDLA